MAKAARSAQEASTAALVRRDVWPVARGATTSGGPPPATPAALRKFGLVMVVPLAVLGGALLWKARPGGPHLLAAAAAFALAAVAAPRLLAPVERVWMAFARVLGTAMTYVVLAVTWVLLVTPIGLFMRLTGKDLLAVRRRPERATWWVPVEPDGPCGRPDKPF